MLRVHTVVLVKATPSFLPQWQSRGLLWNSGVLGTNVPPCTHPFLSLLDSGLTGPAGPPFYFQVWAETEVSE